MPKKSGKKLPSKSSSKAAGKPSKKAVRATASRTPKAVAKKAEKKAVKQVATRVAKKAATKVASTVRKQATKASPKTPAKSAVQQILTPPHPRAAPAPTPTASGPKAPAFQLPRDGGETVSLKDYAGSKLVLFFYPRADTPGCTREAIDFTRLSKAFAAAGTQLLGVSADAPKDQEAFREKHDLSMPLVSDEAKDMIRAYGAWGQKSMYGRTFEGILRTTVLIDPTGKIAQTWRNVKVDGHAEEVLEAAKAL